MTVFDLGAPAQPGALTRAVEQSVGGTVVLERVDEAPAPLAAELVGLLERRERGEIDVRPIATSRSDLRARVEEGRVRRDLYFHLAGVRVAVPPLRERLEDLPLLVRHLVESLGYEGVTLSASELAPLRNRDLPGNVRELGRIIEETLLTTRSGRLRGEGEEDTWGGVTDELARLPFKEAKEKLVEAFEKQYVAELLERHDGNLSRAAAAADIDRNYLARLAKKHGIR
jgi:DNA-binding NtrC family response regulator